jgi:hypothetical protein
VYDRKDVHFMSCHETRSSHEYDYIEPGIECLYAYLYGCQMGALTFSRSIPKPYIHVPT